MKNGTFEYFDHKNKLKTLEIQRMQIVQDTAEQIHADNLNYLDFNRAGMGMLKIYTNNGITHPSDAPLVVKDMRSMFRHLLISKANFDKGSMRVKVDVQMYKSADAHANKVSFKNLRSYNEIELAIISEVRRQAAVLDKGETVVGEVRKFDLKSKNSVALRSEKKDVDFRYLAENDIPAVKIS